MFKTEVTNGDLTTKEGWDTYLAYCCKQSGESAAKAELGTADCALVCTVSPETFQPFDHPQIVLVATCFMGQTSEEADAYKTDYEFTVRTMAVAGRAFAAVFTSEVWRSKQTDLSIPLIWPKDDPAREEAVLITSEHRDFGFVVHSAAIHGAASARTLDPWVHETPRAYGRFASFVPPLGLLNDEKAQTAAKRHLETQRDKIKVLFRKESHAAS